MKDLIERLKARVKYAEVIGGCNTVPVPMFLFQQTIAELESPALPEDVEMACLNLRTRIGAPEYANMLENLAQERERWESVAYSMQGKIKELEKANIFWECKLRCAICDEQRIKELEESRDAYKQMYLTAAYGSPQKEDKE